MSGRPGHHGTVAPACEVCSRSRWAGRLGCGRPV